MFAEFMRTVRPGPRTRILDLGVTSDEALEANFFETLYPHRENITCAGVEDAAWMERRYPGTRFVRIEPRRPLPFADGEFDVVFSNAVVEHTGPVAWQRFFVAEALRVAPGFFLTTPNRWFPVDLHTGLPLLHWLPKGAHRAFLRLLGFRFYASEDNLNLLSPRGLRSLFPVEAAVTIRCIRLLGLTSNLIATGSRERAGAAGRAAAR
jgi:hypothetical protein